MRSEGDRWQFRRARAAEMRRFPTKAESAIGKYLLPLGFESQVSIEIPRLNAPARKDGYILDFYHAKAKLCIEVDGGVHKSQQGRDARRDRRLTVHGIRTIRVQNAEALHPRKLVAALERIISALNAGAGE